jgi:GNAT superfamily N-acetyltransferase
LSFCFLSGSDECDILDVMHFSIAPITAAQIPMLLEMIRELARFERLEHEVEASVEMLRNSLCGPQPSASALLARHGDEPAGYALYFFTFCSFAGRQGLWLDDLYVRPEFRKKGLGRALLQEVARIGVERNVARMEWIALDWNEKALRFYDRIGAGVQDDWVLLRLNSQGVKEFAAAESNRAESN